MRRFYLDALLFVIVLNFSVVGVSAQDSVKVSAADLQRLMQRVERLENQMKSADTHITTNGDDTTKRGSKVAFSIGGYGEATYKRAFYSNNYLRYASPEQYKNDTYGEFDLPHVCIWMDVKFARGWEVGAEIEFEHGGTEAAVEIEEEEGGEYETEVERGGEVALEQLWVQKTFCPYAALRAGMIVVPLGGTNANHEPDKFFGVYRPEGENTILPCTWHEVGIEFHGRVKWFGYMAQFLPGLESDLFSRKNWIQGGSPSPYEFKIANTYAGLVRMDFYPLTGHRDRVSDPSLRSRVAAPVPETLRISLSGYAGTSFKNSLTPTTNSKYEGVTGLVTLGSVDWNYSGHGFVFRGSGVYGHLGDAAMISAFNKSMSKSSVSKRENVASDAYSFGAELGYDFFSLSPKLRGRQNFYLWARYDIYDAQAKIEGTHNYWTGRQKVSCGVNYYPIPQVIVKAEFGYGILNQNPYAETQYNNEPYVAMSVNFAGVFWRSK